MTKAKTALVIGGGHNGLICATYLVIQNSIGVVVALGLDLHLLLFDLGGLPQTALHETLQRFAEDVLPHVQSPEGGRIST